MLYLGWILAIVFALLALFLYFLGSAEYKLRVKVEQNRDYWRDIAEGHADFRKKHYVGLRECYEEAQKLYAFIGQRYHGES